MILGACVKPVGVNDFLKDFKLGGSVDLGVDYEHPKDNAPILVSVTSTGTSTSTSTVIEEAKVTVSKSSNVTIVVANATDYNNGMDYTIEWVYGEDVIERGVIFTVNIAKYPFNNNEGRYLVSVEGKTPDGVLYSVLFYIIVDS
jgi:hypothetical protein